MTEITQGSVEGLFSPLLGRFFRLTRQKERGLVIPNKRLITQLGGKSVPALRVAPEKAPLGVARTHCTRCARGADSRIFGITKPHSSRRQLAPFQEQQ